jgi:hypothetical protein
MKYLFLLLLIPTICFAESYKTMSDGRIQRQSDLTSIPPTTANPDYVKYLEDVKNGAEVKPFDYQAEEIRNATEQAKIKDNLQKENLIQDKIKQQAIDELIKEGKLDANGNLTK